MVHHKPTSGDRERLSEDRDMALLPLSVVSLDSCTHTHNLCLLLCVCLIIAARIIFIYCSVANCWSTLLCRGFVFLLNDRKNIIEHSLSLDYCL